MIFGSVRLHGRAVETHRDSYLLSTLTVISVRRPFLVGGALFALGSGGFAAAFRDLLYPAELVGIGVFAVLSLLVGLRLAQIQLFSRDLRGSELAGMIFGTYGHLNRVRHEITDAMRDQATGGVQ
ncbi:MAG: hypothetical protein AAGG47_17885 [Pseudomonadota bacterium]